MLGLHPAASSPEDEGGGGHGGKGKGKGHGGGGGGHGGDHPVGGVRNWLHLYKPFEDLLNELFPS